VTVLSSSLLTDAEVRLGRRGTKEIMQHHFFKGTMWETLHSGMESVSIVGHDFSSKQQSTILPSFISRTLPTTRTFLPCARIAFPTQNKNKVQQHIRRSTFPLSFNHRKTRAHLPFRFCERHHVPFFARRPSPSSSGFHGDLQQTRSRRVPRPLQSHPLTRTTLQLLGRLP
jgi:hypothetical protein